MAKSYTEQLAEWVRQRGQAAKADRNRVAFLAVKDDVREAMEEGWPVKTIWSHMVEQQRIGFGYDTFLAYVKRHVKGDVDTPRADRSSVLSRPSLARKARALSPPKGESTPSRPDQNEHATAPMSGFTFNAAPKREELI